MVQPREKLKMRPCAFKRCGKVFQPVVAHQDYCRVSHRIMAFQEKKFDKAVEAAVQKRLQEMGIIHKNGSHVETKRRDILGSASTAEGPVQ